MDAQSWITLGVILVLIVLMVRETVPPAVAMFGATMTLFLLGIIGGLTAWALVTGGIEQMSPVAALFAVLVTLVGIYLARVPAYHAQVTSKSAEYV